MNFRNRSDAILSEFPDLADQAADLSRAALDHANQNYKLSPRQRREERDRARGYSINVKQVLLAFAVEFWIIGLIIIGTYLLIADSGDRGRASTNEIFSALLLPAALAMVELARVPLALAVRTQPVWHIKLLAALGVLAAITVTSFSLSQIAWKTFDIRTAEATRTGDRLADIRAKKEDLQTQISQSKNELGQKIQDRTNANDRLANLQQQLTKVSSFVGQACKPMLDPDGKPIFGGDGKPLQSCSPSASVNQAQLNAIKAQITSTQREVELTQTAVKQAEDQSKRIDLRPIQDELAKAEAEYRLAVNNSQLHSYTAMVTGKAVADVTEADVKRFEKYLIIIPSIAAAFASTLIAITAVQRIKAPRTDAPVAIPDEAAAYLFGPLLEAIRQETRAAIAAAVAGKPNTS